jgi:hypothetical protein
MFLQIFIIFTLAILIVVLIELKKIKQSLDDLESKVKKQEASAFSNGRVTENWWGLEMPEVKVPTSILKSR